jgi:hypothetical protein
VAEARYVGTVRHFCFRLVQSLLFYYFALTAFRPSTLFFAFLTFDLRFVASTSRDPVSQAALTLPRLFPSLLGRLRVYAKPTGQ